MPLFCKVLAGKAGPELDAPDPHDRREDGILQVVFFLPCVCHGVLTLPHTDMYTYTERHIHTNETTENKSQVTRHFPTS